MKLLLILALAISTMAQSVVMAPILDVSPRETFTVPIEIDEVEGLFAYQFSLAFDRTVMVPFGYNPCEPADFTEGFSVNCNVVDGVIRVSGYAGHEVTGSGPIVNVLFKARKKGCGELKLSDTMAWAIPVHELKVLTEDGIVCVVQ